jgi:integrating conjugative element relaxase (TIGR03760 family)
VRLGNKRAENETAAEPERIRELSKGLLRPQSAVALLSTPRRALLIQHIWQRTSLSRSQFQRLYQAPIERYAELVQLFPASESHHHAYMGGMLDHGLEIVAFGLKLRQSYLLPIGGTPELQAAQAEAWTAAVAYAALLHDVGKLAVDLDVEHGDGTPWHPWHGPLERPYRFRFRAGRVHRLHEAAAGLLYSGILGPTILDWLSEYMELWAALLYVLASRHEHSGVLGELVAQADRASVAQALGGDPGKARPDASLSLQRKLREGLRYLVRERFKLNQPQASDGWLTQDALWLVSKTACDKLRAHLLSNGVSGVPENNSVLFDVLQEHGLVQRTPDDKAIWTARVLGENGWTQEFTFLKLAPTLIWDTGARPPDFQGSVVPTTGRGPSADPLSQPPRLEDSPRKTTGDESPTSAPRLAAARVASDAQTPLAPEVRPADDTATIAEEHAVEPPRFGREPLLQPPSGESPSPPMTDTSLAEPPLPSPHGERFLQWLRQSVQMRRLIVNDAKALVHSVDGTAFIVTPRIFQRFLQEFPVIRLESRATDHPPWMVLQKSFERLGRHRKQENGLNIWTCEVAGPRKTRSVNGYLLLDGHDIFSEVPPDNPYLRLIAPGPAAEN